MLLPRYEAVSRNATSTNNTELAYGMDARAWVDLMWPSVFAAEFEQSQ